MEENTQQVQEQENKRPTFLTVLCILTFIGSGLGTLTYLLMTVGMGSLMSYLGSFGGGALGGGTAFFGVGTVLAAASLYGAIMMWKLKKMGFYIYAAANVISIILPLFFGIPFSAVGAVIPVVFIVLYGLNLKVLN